MKQGKFILFAWADYEAHGGINDICGWFNSVHHAVEFFKKSKHCSDFDKYHVIDSDTFDIMSEGQR